MRTIQYFSLKQTCSKKHFLLLITSFCSLLFLIACDMPAGSSIKKDLNTGLTTTTKKMSADETILTMNGETIHHTDIPLGESFILSNNGVKGLKVNNGKVSAGCSLEITDSLGNSLLKEPDLFAGRDVFGADTTSVLKCTINTGAPMKWDETYTVRCFFWDKYGEGNIENVVKITMIDIP
jgi:hypothetical protein